MINLLINYFKRAILIKMPTQVKILLNHYYTPYMRFEQPHTGRRKYLLHIDLLLAIPHNYLQQQHNNANMHYPSHSNNYLHKLNCLNSNTSELYYKIQFAENSTISLIELDI